MRDEQFFERCMLDRLAQRLSARRNDVVHSSFRRRRRRLVGDFWFY
jgi:hypothetical protein